MKMQKGNKTAKYGKQVLGELSKSLSKNYDKGFIVTNLRYMRQFYLTFQNRHSLRDDLSWTHYRLIMKVNNEKAREFYVEEAVKSNWSTRQLARQINTFSYERLLASNANYDVVNDTTKKEVNKKPEDIIKDPYVLKFLGLEGNYKFIYKDN